MPSGLTFFGRDAVAPDPSHDQVRAELGACLAIADTIAHVWGTSDVSWACVRCGGSLRFSTAIYDEKLGGAYHAGPLGSCPCNINGRIIQVNSKYVRAHVSR